MSHGRVTGRRKQRLLKRLCGPDGEEKAPASRRGFQVFQVRERSVPRSNRGSAPEVKAVNQGGHDGLSEELVIGKETGE